MTNYILGESGGETARLVAQSDRDPVEAKLRWAGLAAGDDAIDAGCGPGVNARIMARLAGATGSVRAFDMSGARIDAARALAPEPGAAPIEFRTGDVHAPPFAEASADFVYCQYVLEYLREPARAIDALGRLVRPGGTLCVVDGDGIGTTMWPAPAPVAEGLPKLVAALGETGFDPYVGRRLFHLMVQAGFADVRVTMHPLGLAAGVADPTETEAWRQRLAALAPFGERAFGSASGYSGFVHHYLAMLADPAVLKYVLVLAVAGRRP